MAVKSQMRLVAMAGMVLSLLSLAAHFLLARFSTVEQPQPQAESNFHAMINLRELTHIRREVNSTSQASHFGKVWGHVKALRSLHPHAGPREYYPPPSWPGDGYIFAEIKGDFHNIRSSICDLVAIARLLNASLVIPSLRAVSSAKGISNLYRGFSYLYDEQHFIAALAEDVRVVKKLPKNLRTAKKNKLLPIKSSPKGASPEFYVEEVLPRMKEKGAIGLLIHEGGGLQSVLPAELAEYQRLRCRVAFHALRFRQEIHELGLKVVSRLQARGQPYLAVHAGLERDSLAFHGCAECFQDVHTESIQYKRALMIKDGVVKGELNIDSEKQRAEGLCPLFPEEIGVLLRAMGYSKDTLIYVSGTEIFGGQRMLLPLRSMFHHLEDLTTVTTDEEVLSVFGPEEAIESPPPPPPDDPEELERLRLDAWAKAGPRPRPLPPPAGRPKLPHEVEGWWGWIGESDKEPVPTRKETREQGHRLLLAALDYIVSVEADAFFPAFDADKSDRPNFASLVMGHRAYAIAAQKTFRPDRKVMVKYLDEIRERLYNPGRAWVLAVRGALNMSLGAEGLARHSLVTKPRSFISHPLPECVCRSASKANVSLIYSQKDDSGRVLYGDEELCPEWMKHETLLQPITTERQREDDLDYLEESVYPVTEDRDPEVLSGESEKDEDDADQDMELEED